MQACFVMMCVECINFLHQFLKLDIEAMWHEFYGVNLVAFVLSCEFYGIHFVA